MKTMSLREGEKLPTIREEIYDRLHPLLEDLVDATCDQIESIEDISSVAENFDIVKVLEQLEVYGKYKGVLRWCEGENFEKYIPVSVAKQIVKGRGLGGALGYLENMQ